MEIKKYMFIIMIFLILFSIPHIRAAECEYGSVEAFFSKDGENWQKATVQNSTLKRGEAFFIKAYIRSKINLSSIDIKIWETGENSKFNSTFKLIEGFDCFFSFYDIYPIKKDDNLTYIWQFNVKHNTKWFNGNAPLNLFVQFDKNEEVNEQVSFTIVNFFIKKDVFHNNSDLEIKEENSDINYDKTNYKSAFLGLFSFLILILVIAVIYKRK